jgi:outer membrane protein assembly factor BamA
LDDIVSNHNDDFLTLKEIGSVPIAVGDKHKGSWLPIPIPMANPTLGTGLVGTLLYLHSEDSPDEPTATSGVGALYTDSESWFVGGFHDDYWFDDSLRFKALIGTGDFNLDYYGVGDSSDFADDPIDYKASTDITILQLLGRISKTSDWYLGVRHTYTSANVVFDLSDQSELLPEVGGSLKTSSVGFMVSRDTRNDNYFPTQGHYLEAGYHRARDRWGSDFDYDKYTGFYNHYLKLTAAGTLALRGDISVADGDTPFYMLPTLKMRGFPSGKYRDDVAISAHIEWRHKFKPRWTYIAFAELGNVAKDFKAAIEGDLVTSIGGGIRWQVLASKSLNLGLDVGLSGDDKALYIQIGERF